ncbi:MAG: dihydrofolate reductase family protein [Candidatus Aenigmarchaeota archaeon]|nr:dihydrofolate reductase family protein [Candidatus Aenigmarchaeota archaeon]
MKVVLFMAQTINGMIARENYEEEFFTDETWDMFVKFSEEIGCFVIGRNTYDIYKKKNSEKFSLDKVNAKRIVVSNNPKLKLDARYILANSPRDALNKANKLGFRKVMVTGGGLVNSSFMKAGLIDEIIINVEPYLLGKGIRIFSEDDFEKKLKLTDVKKLKLGIIQLRYSVAN